MEKKKSKKKIIIIISVIAVLALSGIGVTSCVSSQISNMAQTASEGSLVETDVLEKQDLSKNISVSGTVESGDLVKITSTVTAKVLSLNVDIGDYVKEGDILCVFDSSDIQKEYDSVKESVDKSDEMAQNTHNINVRNLNNAYADRDEALEKADRQITDAEQARDEAYDKYNNLVNEYNKYNEMRNNLSNELDSIQDEFEYEKKYQQYQEYNQICDGLDAEIEAASQLIDASEDAVTNAYDLYNSTLKSAELTLQGYQDVIDAEKFSQDNSGEKQLEAIQKQLDECVVKATKSGIITSLNIAEGSIPTSDALMTIEDSSKLKITVNVKEADILNVKKGLKATVRTDATGSDEISGTVTRVVNIMTAADPISQQGGGYTAEIEINDKDTKLLIGMNAKVKIILEENPDALAVPYDAITQDKDGNDIIYIAEKSDDGTYKAKSVKIEKGIESDYYTEIISDEVKEGDIFVLTPNIVYNGKTLNISENNESDDISADNSEETEE